MELFALYVCVNCRRERAYGHSSEPPRVLLNCEACGLSVHDFKRFSDLAPEQSFDWAHSTERNFAVTRDMLGLPALPKDSL